MFPDVYVIDGVFKGISPGYVDNFRQKFNFKSVTYLPYGPWGNFDQKTNSWTGHRAKVTIP